MWLVAQHVLAILPAMIRLRIVASLILVAVCLTAVSPQPTSASPPQQNAAILQGVNNLRAGYGLPPLQYNAALAAAAQNQANYMAANNVYSHTGAGGSSPQSRANAAGYNGYATENIVGGTGLTPEQGIVWWKNSPVHLNSMISNRYTEAGVGYAVGNGQNFYAMVFGSPSGSGGAPAPNTAGGNGGGETAVIAVAPIFLNEAAEDGSLLHTVGDGQTIWAIAARYEVDIADLYLFNNMTESDFLQPGDELIIQLAEGAVPPPTPTPPASYTVQKGDTSWTIAARHSISLADLLWMNGLDENDFLHLGDEVTIRLLPGQVPPPTPTPQQTHIVRTGDTALGIALLYGLSLNEFLGYNDMDVNALLSVGMELRVAPMPAATPEPLPRTPTPIAPATIPPTQTPDPYAAPNAEIAEGGYPPQATEYALLTPTATAVFQQNANTETAPATHLQPMSIIIGLVIAGLGLLAGAAILIIKSDA